ncbi:MAG: hypothetical protein CM1200mP21_01320 [Candidatus Poseidoniales archaeon]|nr:MAG: hypothetical protein CM1200mP21_01320 [Candidatus Poseidoniales archaeon]
MQDEVTILSMRTTMELLTSSRAGDSSMAGQLPDELDEQCSHDCDYETTTNDIDRMSVLASGMAFGHAPMG